MKSNQKSNYRLILSLLSLIFLFLAKHQLVNGQIKSNQMENLPGIPAGYTIVDGDIQIPTTLLNSLRQQWLMKPSAPQATIEITKFWPNVVIPFKFETVCAPTSTCTGAPNSGCVSAANQALMINAMAVLEAVANIDFQQCAGNNCNGNYILIRDTTNDTTVGQGNACESAHANNSPVGIQGGGQTINIFNWNVQFIMVHELMHSLGFFHEQSRPDRNSFVSTNCNNVQGGCNGNIFLINFPISNSATAYGYYDFDSVMHYGQCSFSINPNCPLPSAMYPDGGITITVLPPNNTQWQNAIGQRNHLSTLDAAVLSFIYPQSNWRFVNTTYSGGNGPSNGSFLRPYTTFSQAITNTPAGGTIWLLRSENIPAIGTHNKQIIVRASPGVVGTLGN